MRRVIVIGVVLVVAGVAAVALIFANLNRLIERHKDQIVAQAEQALGRKLAVGEITVGLWGGIGVRLAEFALADDREFSSGDFVRARELQVNLRLWPLLWRQFEVKRLVLRQPAATVIRDKEGRFNFSTMGAAAKEGDKEKRESAQGGGAPLALLVSRLELSEGRVRYVDKKEGIDVGVDRLSLRMQEFKWDRPFQVDLSAALMDSKPNLTLKATLGPADPAKGFDELPLRAELRLDGLSWESVKKSFPGVRSLLPRDLDLSGLAALKEVTIQGTLKELLLKGTAELTESAFRFGKVLQKPKGIPFVISLDSRLGRSRIFLKSAEVRLHGLKLTAKGEASWGSASSLDLTLASQRTDLKGWEELMPQLKPYRLSGAAQAQARLRGDLKGGRSPLIDGLLSVEQGSFQVPGIEKPIESLNLKAAFKGDRAEVKDATFRLGRSQVLVSAEVQGFSPPAVSYRFSSPALWLSDLAQKDSGAESPGVLKEVRGQGRVETKGGLAVAAMLSSAAGTLAQLNYANLKTDLSLRDGMLAVEDVALQTLKGSLRGQGKIYLESASPRFSVVSQVHDIDLKEYFRSVHKSSPERVEGRLSANLDLNGSGKTWETIKTTIHGKGQAQVVDGKLLDFNLAEGVLSGITGIPGLAQLINPRVREKYPEIFSSPSTNFTDLGGVFTVGSGRVNVEDLRLKAVDYAVRGRGWIDFDQRLDMTGALALSQQLSSDLARSAKEVKYLFEQDRLEIPFGVKGKLPQVRPKPDSEHLTRLLRQGLVRKGAEELERLLPKPRRSPGTQPSPEQERKKTPTEDLIRRGLEGLFGK